MKVLPAKTFIFNPNVAAYQCCCIFFNTTVSPKVKKIVSLKKKIHKMLREF
jgi:hypothetical protein